MSEKKKTTRYCIVVPDRDTSGGFPYVPLHAPEGLNGEMDIRWMTRADAVRLSHILDAYGVCCEVQTSEGHLLKRGPSQRWEVYQKDTSR